MSDSVELPGNAGDPGRGGPPPDGWSSLLDRLPAGVILADGSGRLVEANPAAARILGLPQASLLALDLEGLRARAALAPGSRTGEAPDRMHCGWTRDSLETIQLGWSEQALPGGGVLVSFEDITEAQAQAARLERMTRLYAALSQVNQAIVWMPTRRALLDKICEVMVVFGKFTTAWIGLDDPATHQVEVTSQFGDTGGALVGLQVRSDDSPLGRGGVGSAIREGRPYVINDFLGTDKLRPWHAIALRCHFAAMASFPFRGGGGIRGALTVYASEKGYFGPDEIALLEEAAGDLSFALEHLELDSRREQAERALQQAQAGVTALIESTRDLIWSVDRDHRLLIFNTAFADHIRANYGTAAAPGVVAEDLLPPGRAGMWGPMYERAFSQGAFAREIDIGDGRTLEVSLHPILGDRGAIGASVFGRDITERKRSEERLSESLEFNLKLLDARPQGAQAFHGTTGRCVLATETLARIVGGTQPELMAQNFRTIESWQSTGLLAAAERALATGEDQHLEIQVRTVFHRDIWAACHFTTFTVHGEQHLLLSLFDTTERKRAEDAQRQAQKLESLGVLAGGIAHDFNNLLTAIMGNLNLAQATVGEYSPARPFMEKVENTVLKAAELSRQMLAYSGKGHFVVKARDLNAIIQEMTGLLAASLPKKIQLELRPAPVLPPFKADGAQIQQVVMNLITNAADAIGGQEGRIRITTFNADLDREVLTTGFPGQPMEAGNYIVLSVSDTGCGMRPEVLSRIFDPFFTTKASGRGLGLSAMLGILKGHKAGIRIETEVGQGTTFEVFFPALEEGEAQEEAAPSRRERRLAGTVLLVDDEEIILDSTGPALESLGFRVVKARDGAHAVEQFQELGKELALVFMDLSMPRMDGTSAFLAMHRLRPEVPVVLTSGYDEKEATEDLLAQGLAGFIQKPYRIRDLARELDRILAGRPLP